MSEVHLISVDEFCTFHDVETSFVVSLAESGLIQILKVDNSDFIEPEQLNQLEKFTRLYYELDINLEGIETVYHLLQKLHDKQDEVIRLRNRLRFYESE